MKIKFFITSFIITIFTIAFCICSNAKSKVTLNINEDILENGEEFSLSINANDFETAACTIEIYYDKEKVECISEMDNINVLDNKVIYTWVSDTGNNKEIDEILKINFKAKQDGISTFAATGEFYNQKGEEQEIEYESTDIKIGSDDSNNENNIDTESKEENVSSNNADLDIMRVNIEGISPNFDKNITEYYLIVDETIKKINITAIPLNRKAQVQITGNDNLKSGKNIIQIEVTSKDKTNTKNYTINITKTSNPEKANTNLETLAVEGFTLDPEFDNNITTYSIKVPNNYESVNILAIPESTKAKVEIKKSEELQVGNNTVQIKVTAENGITSKTYDIEVYRRNEKEDEVAKQEQEKSEEISQKVLEEKQANNDISNNSSGENNTNDIEINGNNIDYITIIGTLLSCATIFIVTMKIIKNKKKK